MAKVQKTYTPEFTREAVRLVQTSEKPIAQVARELGISDTSIHQWRKELAEHGSPAFPGSGHQTDQEEEMHRLKRELEIVKQERDILKNPYRISLLLMSLEKIADTASRVTPLCRDTFPIRVVKRTYG